MISERLINTVYMWVGMVCGGDVFVTYFSVEMRSCLNFCDEKIYLS